MSDLSLTPEATDPTLVATLRTELGRVPAMMGGETGDLFLDKGHRLWFCKGGTSWHQLA